MDERRASSPAPYRMAALAAAMAWCVYAATTGGSFATDLASYEVTASLVEDGSVAMRYDVLNTEHERNVDGRYYAPVGIGHPVFGVPFYAAAKLLMATGFRPGKSETLTKAAVVFGSTFAAAGCVFFGGLLAWRLWGDPRAAVSASLLLAFATPLWVYAKFGFNAPLAAMCLSAAAYGFTTGTRTRSIDWLFGGGAALGYAVLTRHEMLLGAVPGAVWIWMESRAAPRDRVSWYASAGAPVLVAVIIWLAYNYGRFGNPLDTGLLHDPNVRFDTPLFVGLHGLLLSPGRSLLLYAPLSLAGLLALWRSRREAPSATVFCSLHILVFLLLVAKMHQWDGGESYGPRYLVPILPFVTLPVARWLGRTSNPVSRRAVLALAAVAIAVQLPGVLVDFNKAQLAFARSRPDYSIALTRYTWAGAPLVLNARAAIAAVPENVSYLTGRRTPPAAPVTSDESDRGFSQQFAFSLDFWWLYLFYMGALPRWVALLAPLILLGTAWGLSRRLRRQVDPPVRI
jgi:4-amino-4-deoxy-L-arabinose transferase-like glycosyltransferase